MSEPSRDVMKVQIFQALQAETDFVPTLKIAKAVCGPKSSKKSINSVIYEMEKQQLVKKESDPVTGGNPRFMLTDKGKEEANKLIIPSV